jgi:hypothetical protein
MQTHFEIGLSNVIIDLRCINMNVGLKAWHQWLNAGRYEEMQIHTLLVQLNSDISV